MGARVALHVLQDPHYDELKSYLIDATGLAYYEERDEELANRIGWRLESLGASDCGSYLALLQDTSRGRFELDEIVTKLTIGETYFFRHEAQFEAMHRVVLPDIIQRNRDKRRLRIWSAGCASGPEPYSIAILLRREFGAQLNGWDVQILGTDVNRYFLARAREASYTEWCFRTMSDALRRHCFREKEGRWAVAPEFKDLVSFQYHNLVRHPIPSLVNNLSAFDLILCRNVAIYFDQDVTRDLVQRFHRALVDGGWLIVGHAEQNGDWFASFDAVSLPGTTFYRKGVDAPIVSEATDDAAAAVAPEHDRRASAPTRPSESRDPRVAGRAAPPAARKTDATEEIDAPSPPPPDFERLRELADRGALDEALRVTNALLERDQLDARLHFYKALLVEQLIGDVEAERSLRAAIYLDRGYVLAHYQLGLVLQKRGKLRRAARCFENVRVLVLEGEKDRVLDDADGLTGAELLELADKHLEILHKS